MKNCYLLLLTVLFHSACNAQPFDEAPSELSVMTWNVEWMYDDYVGANRSKLAKEQSAPSKEYWYSKLNGVAEVIASQQPHIVALQEIEGIGTLAQLRSRLQKEHGVS